MAVASTLRQRTYAQIDEIPDGWRMEFLTDLLDRLPSEQGLKELFAHDMDERGYRVSIPYQYPIDRGPGNTNSNNNYIYNTTVASDAPANPDQVALVFLETSKSENLKLAKIVSAASEHLRQHILDEVEGKRRAGKLTSTPSRFGKYLVDNTAGFNLMDGAEVLAARQRERIAAAAQSHEMRRRELELQQLDRDMLAMTDRTFEQVMAAFPKSIRAKVTKRRTELQAKATVP